MDLYSGENILKQERGVTLDENKSVGTLSLTNKRLVLDKVVSHTKKVVVVKKTTREVVIAFQTLLDEISDTDLVKKRFGKVVGFKIRHGGSTTQFTVSDPQHWIDQIKKAREDSGAVSDRAADNSQTANQAGYGLNINLNVPTNPQQNNQTAQRDVVKIRCTKCGNTYDENLFKCPHCGS